jgi:hypothetical protein
LLESFDAEKAQDPLFGKSLRVRWILQARCEEAM